MQKAPVFVTLAALLSLLLSACANTGGVADASATQAQSAVAANDAGDDRIDPNAIKCKTTIKTGSRISTKICKTHAEWEEAAREAREAADVIQRESTHTAGMTGS